MCIGPGTGIAPFRSIVNERINKHNLTNNHIYFGCRSRTKDFYFEREWSALSARNACRVHAAFSRDQPEKIYVQDVLWLDRDDIFELIDNDKCYVLIAGNSKRMPQDVMAFLERIVAHGLLNIKQGLAENTETAERLAKDYIQNLEKQKSIQLETWS